ncbi:MAG TPA: MerR family transcriptional regulator [Mobilitalea sp.]|nr:MerR family transcriptional regulator [Mobilitalea sp.]
MRTVNQVSKLTGISVRTLHYYDEIGLFKPSKLTDTGYRLYDDDALEALQQILFFKELDFSLKDIKAIMLNPMFDKIKAFDNQKKLIQAKRDRLDGLLSLLDKLVKGEKCMSFKEFDMSEYFQVLDEFRENHSEEVMKRWGSLEKFDKMVDTFKTNESEMAKMAIKQYGSIEKYTQAMKENMNHMKSMDSIHANTDDYIQKNTAINQRLTADLSKDPSSNEIQMIVEELVSLFNEFYQDTNMGENFWALAIEGYTSSPEIIATADKIYGQGASEFIGQALKVYWS